MSLPFKKVNHPLIKKSSPLLSDSELEITPELVDYYRDNPEELDLILNQEAYQDLSGPRHGNSEFAPATRAAGLVFQNPVTPNATDSWSGYLPSEMLCRICNRYPLNARLFVTGQPRYNISWKDLLGTIAVTSRILSEDLHHDTLPVT